MIKKRELVSFDDICPFNCKHCYTFELDRTGHNRTINEIVDSLAGKEFDVVYVSQRKDNFVNPDEGLELCEKLYDRYNCNLIAITRNTFDNAQLDRLTKLNNRMRANNKFLFMAVSIPALESAKVTEDLQKIPTPQERMEFLEKISERGVLNILLIRPLFPDALVPVEEVLRIIQTCKKFVSCIVSSGLAVNEHILKRLNLKEDELVYSDEKIDYLVGAIEGNVKYIDVKNKIEIINNECKKWNIPFFEHSVPALNYLIRVTNNRG